jgi:hypothetical protein
VYGDFQSGKEGKPDGIQYVDQYGVNIGRLSDPQNCLCPFPSLLRRARCSFSMGDRDPGMVEVRSARVS